MKYADELAREEMILYAAFLQLKNCHASIYLKVDANKKDMSDLE